MLGAEDFDGVVAEVQENGERAGDLPHHDFTVDAGAGGATEVFHGDCVFGDMDHSVTSRHSLGGDDNVAG